MRKSPVGRIRTFSKLNGKKLWTLFDSGSRNTYIAKAAAKGLKRQRLPVPKHALLGGKTHRIEEMCAISADIEGHSVDTLARVIDDIGQDEDGKPIDILFGALSMQEWGIRLDVPKERLDWTHYTKEFVEF
jgi:hypothetical protein